MGCQEILGATSKFDLGVQKELGQMITEFGQENTLVIENTLSNSTSDSFTHGHHQMANVKIRLITFFAPKNREILYSKHKQDLEVTLAQIISNLGKNSGLN